MKYPELILDFLRYIKGTSPKPRICRSTLPPLPVSEYIFFCRTAIFAQTHTYTHRHTRTGKYGTSQCGVQRRGSLSIHSLRHACWHQLETEGDGLRGIAQWPTSCMSPPASSLRSWPSAYVLGHPGGLGVHMAAGWGSVGICILKMSFVPAVHGVFAILRERS